MMTSLLQELVDINSYSGNPEGGGVVAQLLVGALSAIDGVSVQVHPSADFAPHLTARTTAAESASRGAVALVGHYDTVFPAGTFEGFVRDGALIRGPGVLDMKGGLVVMITALGVLADAGLLSRIPIRTVIVSDEEVGSPEGGDIIAGELRDAGCALVFEAGREGDAIITARKGTGALTATVTRPPRSLDEAPAWDDNAVVALLRFVEGAQQLTDYERGITVSVGTVSGGLSALSAPPQNARAVFDLRFIAYPDGSWLVAQLEQLARELSAGLPEGVDISLEGGIRRSPLQRTDDNVALCSAYGGCARAAGLGGGEAALIGGGSDASMTAQMGIPTIDGLGPRGRGFHTREEYIETHTLVQRLEALVRFLWSWR